MADKEEVHYNGEVGLTVKSSTDRNVVYFFSSLDADRFKGGAPKHLTDKFDIDLTSPTRNVERFKGVIKDCAHPELRITLETEGIIAVRRYIRACGVNGNPIYVYRTELDTYTRTSCKSAR